MPFTREEVGRSLPERFARVARACASEPAICAADNRLTYEELDRRSDTLAAAIMRRTSGREAPVAVLLSDQVATIISLLATWKAGRLCVPLDHTHPPSRLDVILRGSEAGLVVTDEAGGLAMQAVAGAAERQLRVDELDFEDRVVLPPVSTRADHPACLLYTSGSTGEPKGVVRTHENLLHRSRVAIRSLGAGPGDRVSALHSPSLSVGLRDVLTALLSGAALLPFDLRRAGLRALASWIEREKVSVLGAVVTTFRHLVASLDPGERFESVRIVRLGAEPVYRPDLEQFREHLHPDCVIVAGYGASEANGIVEYRLEPGMPLPTGRLPAGYPVEGVEIFILDDDGHPVEPGQTGEVTVRSRHLSPGYWRRPDLTEKTFLRDPVDAQLRIYRTGDVGRVEPDGCLEVLGRKDDRLKVRGYLVHPGEIELALLAHPAIREALVVGRSKAPGEIGLVAYVVPAERAAPPPAGLRRFLGSRLPVYMIPSAFVSLEAFPANASGKVDRAALPAPADPGPARAATPVPPRNALERQIARLWEGLLDVRPVGAFDDFFDLGGDSLLAAALVTALEDMCGRSVSPSMLIECSTVADLAAALAGEEGHAGEPRAARASLVAIQPGRADTPPLFCVPGHQGTVLCFHQLARQLGPEQAFYGFEPRGLDGHAAPHARVEDMAAAYIEEIRAVQPRGPYFLGGYCFGGLVAFEMAQQLRARGERIGLLALFETPGQGARKWGSLARITRRLAVERANVAGLELRQKLGYVTAKVRAVASRIGAAAEHHRSLMTKVDLDRRTFARAQRAAARGYVPRPYPGPLVLFWAQRPFARRFVDPRFGWGEMVTGRLEVRPVPVASGSVIQNPESARLIAAELRERLRASDGHGDGAPGTGGRPRAR